MAVLNRDVIGHIECHLCGARATVHASKIGRGGAASSLYYRCGVGAAGCGCIQPRGPRGQEIIKGDMVPLGGQTEAASVEPEAASVEQVAAQKPEAETKAKPAGVFSRLGSLLAEEG